MQEKRAEADETRTPSKNWGSRWDLGSKIPAHLSVGRFIAGVVALALGIPGLVIILILGISVLGPHPGGGDMASGMVLGLAFGLMLVIGLPTFVCLLAAYFLFRRPKQKTV